MQTDGKENGLGAVERQCREYGLSIFRPRSVIEREHDFALLQKVVSLELLETEAGPACRVNLDHSRDTKRFGLAPTWRPGARPSARSLGACRNRRRRRNRYRAMRERN